MTDETQAANIGSVFEDEPAQAADEVAGQDAKGAETEQKPAQADADDEKTSDAGEEGKAATPADKDEPKSVPIAALHDERRKAQTYKERLEAAEARLKALEPEAKDENVPDPVADPQAYEEYVWNKRQAKEWDTRVSSSRAAMLEQHGDYEKQEKVFMFLASQDPELSTQLRASPDPARFAYDKAREYQDAERARIKAEILAEAGGNAEGQKPSKEDERRKAALGMPDLTKATATGSNSEPPAKLSNLSDLLADRPF